MTTDDRVVITPERTELTAPYWEAAERGEIALQRCHDCGRVWHPPQPACPSCRSASLEWIIAEGSGTVYTFTTVHHAVHRAVIGRAPYVVCLVELTEGPRVICNLLGVDPDTVRVGMEVRIGTGEAAAGMELPQAFPVTDETDGAA